MLVRPWYVRGTVLNFKNGSFLPYSVLRLPSSTSCSPISSLDFVHIFSVETMITKYVLRGSRRVVTCTLGKHLELRKPQAKTESPSELFGYYFTSHNPPPHLRGLLCFLPSAKMDLNSLKEQVSNLTLYDLKAGVRKVQNGIH